MAKALTSDDPKVTNQVVAQAFAAAPPATMAEVAAALRRLAEPGLPTLGCRVKGQSQR